MGFFPMLVMTLLWLGSVVFGVIAAAAMITYVRRTWQLIRADEDGSLNERLLDGLDQIQTQLHLLSERLDGVEGPDRLAARPTGEDEAERNPDDDR